MGDLLTYSVCGLYVVQGAKPGDWPNFTWATQATADASFMDVLALTQSEIRQQFGHVTGTTDGVLPADAAFGPMHDGDAPRVDNERFSWAGPSPTLSEDWAIRTGTIKSRFTVCGVIAPSWRVACLEFDAAIPMGAVAQAQTWANVEHNETFWLCGVHAGSVPALESHLYADPWADDQDQMDMRIREWIGGFK